jgi:hypothetical protein
MFDRVGSFAERVATDASRRAFLGRLGQGASVLAAVIGGVLALPSEAQAGGDWCLISLPRGCRTYKAHNGTCPCGGVPIPFKHGGCININC